MSMRYEAAHLLLEDGWVSPGHVEVGEDGYIVAAGAGAQPGGHRRLSGYVVPGVCNLHSHAHHRGLVGWVDAMGGGHQTLWRWREHMYDHVLAITPDDLETQATHAYIEMLKRGFTAVGEFHYVHNDPAGRPYAQPEELSLRIAAAARRSGIALTLLPTLYTSGGVGRPAEDRQRRFVLTLDAYSEIVAALRSVAESDPLLSVGVAPHSLRAVGAAQLQSLLAGSPTGPVHIHAAERTEEVEEVKARLGGRPVEWLLGEAGVDARWTIIHATHMTEAERTALAASGAVAGLCPLTEANLADGRFSLPEYRHAGGAWGVGSDANHLIDLAGELRTLEYGQRLHHHRRDTFLAEGETSVALALFGDAVSGGVQALAQPGGGIRPGARADLVELNPEDPALAGQSPATVLDAWVFSSASQAIVRNVMVGGRWVVQDGRHAEEDRVRRDLAATIDRHRMGG